MTKTRGSSRNARPGSAPAKMPQAAGGTLRERGADHPGRCYLAAQGIKGFDDDI